MTKEHSSRPHRRRRMSYSTSPSPPPRPSRRRESGYDQSYRSPDSSRPGRKDPDSRRQLRRSRSRSPRPTISSPVNEATELTRKARGPLQSQERAFNSHANETSLRTGDSVQEKQRPNFRPTGALAAEANKVELGSKENARTIVLKYHEPPEARKAPKSEAWMLYIFKSDSEEPLHTFDLQQKSCWLLGREEAVSDIALEHPSLSKQHAVLQFKLAPRSDKVRLYVLDLESANGSFLNGNAIVPARFVECRSNDVLTFGKSRREYVILQAPSG